MARDRLVREGVTGEEKPIHDVGCRQDFTQVDAGIGDRVIRGRYEATQSSLCQCVHAGQDRLYGRE